MKERPILFSGPMVRAILDGSKTQTRRVCKVQPKGSNYLREAVDDECYPDKGKQFVHSTYYSNMLARVYCPYGESGDRLWVRETFCVVDDPAEREPVVDYRADGIERIMDKLPAGHKKTRRWKPSIHMPRKFCRLLLDVKAVRVERLNAITCGDVRAEGFPNGIQQNLREFKGLWDSFNEKRGYGWSVKPWVWVVEFEKVAVIK